MKVVQILYSGLGGHGSVAFSLLRSAREKSADTRTWENSMLFVGIEPLLPAYALACELAGIRTAFVQTSRGRSWAAWASIYRALSGIRPDAIILHSIKTILPCAMYARRHSIPLIAVEHQANVLKHRSEWWISRLLMRYADAVVVLTTDYRTQLQQHLGKACRDIKVHVIANGIDTIAYQPCRSVSVPERTRVIGMASRMTGIKRQDMLIDAISMLCERDGRGAWQLSLAGDGDTLNALRKRVRDSKLEDVVVFPGYLDEESLKEWFRSLHIYAHASSGETLSTSMLQALAMGLPIVGSDVPGIRNLLAEGGGVGLTVPQTPQAFADAFQRLSGDADLASGLGKRARILAVERYSQASMFLQYRDLLDRLCAR